MTLLNIGFKRCNTQRFDRKPRIHEDGKALDVYSGGLAIEPLRELIGKLSYGEEISEYVKTIKYFFKQDFP